MDGQEDACARNIGIEVANAIDIAIILSSGSKLTGQFDTDEFALLAPDRPDELDSAIHVAWYIDHVAQGDRGVSHGCCGCRRSRSVSSQGVQRSFAMCLGFCVVHWRVGRPHSLPWC
jgi:hypothetical protein